MSVGGLHYIIPCSLCVVFGFYSGFLVCLIDLIWVNLHKTMTGLHISKQLPIFTFDPISFLVDSLAWVLVFCS